MVCTRIFPGVSCGGGAVKNVHTREKYHNDIPIGDDCEVCRGLGCLLAPLWLLELAEPAVVVMMAGGAARGGPAGEASAMLGRELEATHVDEWGGKEREKEA